MMTPDTAAHGQARRGLASLPVPPDVPGHTWRPARARDVPAIGELQLACAAVYGNPPDKLVDYPHALGKLGRPPIGDTICCVDREGRMIALEAWPKIPACHNCLCSELGADHHQWYSG